MENLDKLIENHFLENSSRSSLSSLVKKIKLNPSIQDFNFIVEEIEKVHADDLYIPYAGYGTCVNGKWGRCDFLEHCEYGRKFIGETVELDLSFLN
jgi:hypothetical protein